MHELFVVAPPGLEAVCSAEVAALGADRVRVVHGGVACAGDEALILRLNLGCRVASRVLVRIWEGPVANAARIGAVDLRRFLPPGGAFRIEVSGGGAHPARLAAPLEQAIRRQVPGARPAPKGEPAQLFALRLAAGRLVASADASGAHLHQRGYRQETGVAPLRENLAAGILAIAGYDGTQPLFDPFCGSGTFLVEAALLALRRAPGAARTFACEAWPSIDPARAAAVRASLRADERPAPPAPLVGADRNAGALGVARRNAARAGVLEHLRLARADATAAEPPAPTGVLATNPPWGRRVGERRALEPLYRAFGRRLRERFAGWTLAVLVGDEGFAPALGLDEAERHPLRNGGLPCTLLVARRDA